MFCRVRDIFTDPLSKRTFNWDTIVQDPNMKVKDLNIMLALCFFLATFDLNLQKNDFWKSLC